MDDSSDGSSVAAMRLLLLISCLIPLRACQRLILDTMRHADMSKSSSRCFCAARGVTMVQCLHLVCTNTTLAGGPELC
eukprot:1872459-Amphidinium_carterae.1